MKFFYLILFFLAGCNTTMIDAVNYDDFRRQSLLKGFVDLVSLIEIFP